MSTILRKYGEAATIDFDLFEIDGVDFRIDAVHAAGDTKIMKNEGAEANTINGFTDEGQGYSIVLTATEVQAARIVIYIVDQTATKAWLDRTIIIETYGHASAMHAFDLDTASVAQTGDSYARIGAAGAGLTAIDLPNQTMDITGNLSGSVGSVTADVTTDAASRTASKADVSNLDAAISTRSSHSAADVWTSATRTLSSFGTLVADIATAVWAAGTRTLTSFGTLIADIWANITRTITGTVTTDAASRTASKADVSALALEATVNALNNFNPATTEVTTDAASRAASKADISSLALEATVAAMQIDITEILNYEAGDWEIINNQMIFKTKAGATLATYNLTKAGVPDSDSPDKRAKV